MNDDLIKKIIYHMENTEVFNLSGEEKKRIVMDNLKVIIFQCIPLVNELEDISKFIDTVCFLSKNKKLLNAINQSSSCIGF